MSPEQVYMISIPIVWISKFWDPKIALATLEDFGFFFLFLFLVKIKNESQKTDKANSA